MNPNSEFQESKIFNWMILIQLKFLRSLEIKVKEREKILKNKTNFFNNLLLFNVLKNVFIILEKK